MSAPAYTTFCHNGHIVETVVEGSFNPVSVTECPWCHSSLFHSVLYWHDREEDTCLVPHDPIRNEWVKVWNDKIHGEVNVPVYDVSRLAHWQETKVSVAPGTFFIVKETNHSIWLSSQDQIG